MATLIELDVDYGQGNFLGRPEEKFQSLRGKVEPRMPALLPVCPAITVFNKQLKQ
ncbi:MAG: hypothetical protein ACOX3P_04950 [Saccharofermentanales bacterium]|nr:hypothetical protein [Bacillota bacterium]